MEYSNILYHNTAMKKHTLVFALQLIYLISSAQQWITKNYLYDSIIDVKYGTAINFNGVNDTLHMNIYTPKCSDAISRRPLMLIIHGGAFLAGTIYDPNIIKMSRDFAKRGYVTAAIEYRLGFVSDDNAWTCNFPNYSCIFGTDSSEWHRSYFRAIQDGKGALRYLINRNVQYRIDTNNVFVVGESAGGFIALGIGFMDTISEKPILANAISSVPPPHISSQNCTYNVGKTFTTTTIARPDLGNIDGNIEPTTVKYKIMGVGNYYGAIMGDYFKYTKAGSSAPALYLYHQPCDLVVPYNTGRVQAGFSWCMANCYSCFGIANTPIVYGSNSIKNMITTNNYPITIYNDMTTNSNPNSCIFGTWSCSDQINNPCHEIDNYTLRTTNMATFFASKISTTTICLPETINLIKENTLKNDILISPNPFNERIIITNTSNQNLKYNLIDVMGNNVSKGDLSEGINELHFNNRIKSGIYFIQIYNNIYITSYKLACVEN